MARKVFLSVLGTGFYDKCNYGIGEFCTNSPTRFIQTATMEYIGIKEWNKNDAVYILMTQDSRKDNWETSESGTRLKKGAKEAEDYKGLSDEIKAMELPCINDIDISIPDGKNEDEMWKIFDTLFSIIEEEDELYVDLTHSFRYIPMLMMVFCNYAKFLKHITIKSITYGNIFNKRDDGAGTINDLTPLTVLQDWTSAADAFLSTGNVDKISKVYLPEIRERLKESEGGDQEAKYLKEFVTNMTSLVNELHLCQGRRLIEAETLNKTIKSIENINDLKLPSPFKPILSKIENSINPFDTSENVKNGIFSAKWCCDNGLYQQSVTILLESVVSLICEIVKLDWRSETKRKYVNNAFRIISEKNIENTGKWELPKDDELSDEEKKSKLKEIMNIPLVVNLSKDFSKLTDYRNKINHGTMLYGKGQFKNVNTVAENIKKITNSIYNLTFCTNL